MAGYFPVCTFKDKCCFKSNHKCTILTDMPKERDGDCPFRKDLRYKPNRMGDEHYDY